MLPAAALMALALAAAQPEDEAPQRTSPPAAAAAQDEVKPPAASKPADDDRTAPAAVAGARSLTFEAKTTVEGPTLQVVLGQRALFRVDDKGQPVLAKVEEGKLADAHPAGAVKEAFAAPGPGQVAAALDGSAQARKTVLKLWNGLDEPVRYQAIVMVLRQGRLAPQRVNVCPVQPGATRTESWQAPIVAVVMRGFEKAPAGGPPCK